MKLDAHDDWGLNAKYGSDHTINKLESYNTWIKLKLFYLHSTPSKIWYNEPWIKL